MSFFSGLFRKSAFKVWPTEITARVGDSFKLNTSHRATFKTLWPAAASIDASGQGRVLAWQAGVIEVKPTADGNDAYLAGEVRHVVVNPDAPFTIDNRSLEQRVKALEDRMRKHEGETHG